MVPRPAARPFIAEKQIGWAIYSAASGLVYFVLPWTNPELASLLLPVASVVGWGWVSVMAWRLLVQPAQVRSRVESQALSSRPV